MTRTPEPHGRLDTVNEQDGAPLFRVVVWVTCVVLTLFTLGDYFAGTDMRGAVVNLVVVVAAVLALAIARPGRVALAFVCFVWGCWCGITLQALLMGSINNAVLYAYPAIIMLSGWLLGLRHVYGMAALSMGVFCVLAWMQSVGLRAFEIERGSWGRAADLSVVLIISVVILNRLLYYQHRQAAQLALLNAQLSQTVSELTAREKDLSQAEARVLAVNAALEERVATRTQELESANGVLSNTLGTLQRAQTELVQSEKMAALGRVVAGVAHELNTPIGNALVAANALHERTGEFQQLVQSNALKRSNLDTFTNECLEASDLVQRSLRRASDLVLSFKQVAVDQTSERQRTFQLSEVVHEVVVTLQPNLKRLPWRVAVDIPEGIEMVSFPGPLGQVVINLVMNAVTHAFEGREQGTVTVVARLVDHNTVQMVVSDDGIGMEPPILKHIFDPFFTTRLGQGGSGLGLSIVHQMVTQILMGKVSVASSPGQGSRFTLHFARTLEPALG